MKSRVLAVIAASILLSATAFASDNSYAYVQITNGTGEDISVQEQHVSPGTEWANPKHQVKDSLPDKQTMLFGAKLHHTYTFDSMAYNVILGKGSNTCVIKVTRAE